MFCREAYVDIFTLKRMEGKKEEDYTFLIFFTFGQKDFIQNLFSLGKSSGSAILARRIVSWVKSFKKGEKKVCFLQEKDYVPILLQQVQNEAKNEPNFLLNRNTEITTFVLEDLPKEDQKRIEIEEVRKVIREEFESIPEEALECYDDSKIRTTYMKERLQSKVQTKLYENSTGFLVFEQKLKIFSFRLCSVNVPK